MLEENNTPMSASRSDNLFELLDEKFRGAGDGIAFLSPAGRPLLAYRELRALVGRFANGLQSLGVAPGDRVSAILEKSLGAVVLYLAALKCGAAYHPLNPAYTVREVDYFLDDAEPRLLVTSSARAGEVAASAAHRAIRLETLDSHHGGSLAELAARQSELHATRPRSADDLAGLLYTSGTTGRPKGAMITHANLATNALALHRLWAFESGDVLLHALPVFHVHGLYVALHTAFLNGSAIVWLPRFGIGEVLAGLRSATVMMGVPTFYVRLLAEPSFDRHACSNMRLFISGSAPLSPEVHGAFLERTGHAILERYGMTEAGMIASNPYAGERIAGTVGFALPDVDIRIVDEHGNEVPRGTPGIVEIKGPNVFRGYWRSTAAADFRSDGYFITGDLGVLSLDGRLAIVGRARDLIISGGLNVYPGEVENELDRLPGIAESAVIGAPHDDLGEAVIAVVRVSGAALPEAKIAAMLSGTLARFKIPKRIFIVEDLPRNAMGKVQKSELRKRYASTFQP
jgi:malonyl-CoA/methylmalonyl-CoA synthetase